MIRIDLIWHRLRFATSQARQRAYTEISSDERQRVDRLLQAVHRERALASFWSRRQILGVRLGLDPEQFEFVQGPQGRPSFPGIQFNLSHSEDWSVLAVSTSADFSFGVDLELATRALDQAQLAPRFFEAREVDSLRHHAMNPVFFFKIWTAKEAYLKSLGVGLHKPLDSFRVADGSGMLTVVQELATQTAEKFHIRPIAAPAQVPAAVTHLVTTREDVLLQPRFFDSGELLGAGDWTDAADGSETSFK